MGDKMLIENVSITSELINEFESRVFESSVEVDIRNIFWKSALLTQFMAYIVEKAENKEELEKVLSVLQNSEVYKNIYEETISLQQKISLQQNGQSDAIREFLDDFKELNLLLTHTDIREIIENTKTISKQKPLNTATLKGNLSNISDKEHQFALTPLKNQHSYIQQLDETFFEGLEFDSESGTMHAKSDILAPVTLRDLQTKRNLKELDLPVIRTLYTILLSCYTTTGETRAVVYVPDLAQYLGIKARITDNESDNNKKDISEAHSIIKKIVAFRSSVGITGNGSIYPLLNFEGYEKETNSISFSSPYMYYLFKTLTEKNTIAKRNKQTYIKPHHNYLVHSIIAKERNKAAVEIVFHITNLLLRRGEEEKPKEKLTKKEIEKAAYDGAKKAVNDEFADKTEKATTDKEKDKPHKTIARISFKKIIEEIPLLQETLDNTELTRNKNAVLKRAFTKAYELLAKKTDVYKYFINLNIPHVIPTASTLDSVLNITHEGISKT